MPNALEERELDYRKIPCDAIAHINLATQPNERIGAAVITVKTIPKGAVIKAEAVSYTSKNSVVDISQVPDAIGKASGVIGRVAKYGLGPGQVITEGDLEP